MVNGSVSNRYGGSILTKYTAKDVCNGATQSALLQLSFFNYFKGAKSLVRTHRTESFKATVK